MLEVPEHPLDAVTVPVSTEIAWDVLAPIGLGRDYREDTAHQQVRSNRVSIIALVREQGFRLGDWQSHQVIDGAVIRGFAAGQDETERAPLIVAAGVDFARKAAA